MDERECLILVKGQDKTVNVASFEVKDNKCGVIYNGSPKTYYYQCKNVQILKLKQEICLDSIMLYFHNRVIAPISALLDFGDFYKIIDDKGHSKLFAHNEVSLQHNCLSNDTSKEVFEYFKENARAIGLTTENGSNILEWQYDKIRAVSEETILSNYLEPSKPIMTRSMPDTVIYLFGLNKSQKTAVEKALSSSISIIQGPPGTGKTQTILNIIANVVSSGHTLAVVSNNNSATHNIVEKLEKKGVSFLAAFLGSRSNKEQFLNKQTGCYPDMRGWTLSQEECANLCYEIQALAKELDKMFDLKNRIAEIENELLHLKPEQYYFEDYYSTCDKVQNDIIKGMSSKQILGLLSEYEQFVEDGDKISWLKRLAIAFEFKFNLSVFKVFNENPYAAIPYLKRQFYISRQKELQTERTLIEKQLEAYSFEKAMQSLGEKSLKLFQTQISAKYGRKAVRKKFESKDLTRIPEEFANEYPIILSTTYSIKSSLCSEFIYDYVIVDEASQVDLATAVLAFSCANNIVIVGDLQQLPNVITEDDSKVCEKIWNKYSLPEIYRYSRQNLLSTAISTWPEAPVTLLREHYRCHPKIIGFCNQKFYGGDLIIMTDNNNDSDVITLYRTVRGNHARNHKNQRQIDIIKEEILPNLVTKGYESIGIISPYREQAKEIKEQIGADIQVDTVHKYQGREKDAIILTSVDNVISDFVDDPRMLNVAVSRAVKSLTVVTSCDPRNDNTNYGDLTRYIEYNNCQIIESKVRSVFDLLYQSYAEQRAKFLKKHNRISEYDSENLLYSVIETVLQNQEFQLIGCAAHVALAEIIKDYSAFDIDEVKYASNPLTHVDFLLYRTLDKSPLLAIEVDGVAFHAHGSLQSERDCRKDSIFKKCGISLLRLRTDGSGEKEKISKELERVLACS